VAGAVEPRSDIVDRVLAALFADASSRNGLARSDVAAAIVVETEAEARRRGARIVACVRQTLEWRGEESPMTELASPRDGRAEVILSRASDGTAPLLASTAWSACPTLVCAPAVGESDGLGAVAIAVAVGRIASGRTDQALVVGLARGRGYAIVLGREQGM
jgi:hypothetical protein